MPERIELAAEEERLLKNIREAICWLTPPPVAIGMGKGRASVAFKLRAVLHALFLVSGPFDTLTKLLHSIHTWVSDLGTEHHFARAKPIPLKRVFDYLQDADDYEDGEEDFAPAMKMDEVEFAPTSSACDDGAMADMTGSVAVGGLLHIIHNASADIRMSMEHYDDITMKLSDVSRLLSSRESKERLLETCYNGSAVDRALGAHLENFSAVVFAERCLPQLFACSCPHLEPVSGTLSCLHPL